MARIIFKNTDNSIGIIAPSEKLLQVYDINTIAQKNVPYNLSYWIVNDIDIPTDRTLRGAWEADEVTLGVPHGVGSDSNSF